MVYVNNIKKTIILTIFATFLCVGCSKKEDTKISKSKTEKKAQFIIKFSHSDNNQTSRAKAILYFKEQLQKLSDGKIEVKIYPNSQLYKNKEVLAALKLNDIQMVAIDFDKLIEDVPELSFFNLLFLFDDLKHIHKIEDGDIAKQLKNIINKHGYVTLGFWDKGFSQFSSSTKPILTPKDIMQKKIAIDDFDVLEKGFKYLKANPKIISLDERYLKLKSKEIDSQESTVNEIYNRDFYKIQKYITISNHRFLGYVIATNSTFYNSLPKELQKALLKAIQMSIKKQRKFAKQEYKNYLNKIIKYSENNQSVKIFKLTPSQKKAWRESVIEDYKNLYDNGIVNKEIVEKILNN